MSQSKVSIPTTVIDVPEPVSITGNFIYNFYLPTEDTQYHITPTSPFVEYGDTPTSLNMISSNTKTLVEERERGAIRTRVPRYIELSISPNTAGVPTLPLGESLIIGPADDTTKTAWYTGRDASLYRMLKESDVINIEGVIENGYNAAITFQDSHAKIRNQKMIYRISTAKIQNGSILGETSPTDIAAALDTMTSEDVDATSIINMLSDTSPLGQTYVNDVSAASRNPLDEKASIRYNIKFNTNAYREVLSNLMVANPFSSNYLSDLFPKGNQQKPPSGVHINSLLDKNLYPYTPTSDATTVDPGDVQPEIKWLECSPTVKTFPSSPDKSKDPQMIVRHIGFLIEKSGVNPSGQAVNFPDEILLNPEETSFIDPKIMYGTVYTYRVRQLYIIGHYIRVTPMTPHSVPPEFREELGADEYSSAGYQYVTYVVASRAPSPLVIAAKEKTPPPSPSVLQCSFIYKKGNGVKLEWQLPVHNTRDVKKYQVFRRKTIKEPFACIAEYDFTDEGYTQFTKTETISPELVHKVDFPRYYHIDYDFQRESDYIYSIVAVDAHGLSSQLGVQMRAKFDVFTNKLVLQRISAHGAPKAYPNIYLDGQEMPTAKLTEDVMTDSNHHTMRLYFNPDAYHYTRTMVQPDGGPSPGAISYTKENIVLTETQGTYKFQIINLDRQKTKILEVKVEPQESLSSIL
jgi:hypothetical protein